VRSGAQQWWARKGKGWALYKQVVKWFGEQRGAGLEMKFTRSLQRRHFRRRQHLGRMASLQPLRSIAGGSFRRSPKRCQHETVRKETILMYLNSPDFFIPFFTFWTFFSILIFTILRQNDPDVTVRKWNVSNNDQKFNTWEYPEFLQWPVCLKVH
jgi:hypothetical protein